MHRNFFLFVEVSGADLELIIAGDRDDQGLFEGHLMREGAQESIDIEAIDLLQRRDLSVQARIDILFVLGAGIDQLDDHPHLTLCAIGKPS